MYIIPKQIINKIIYKTNSQPPSYLHYNSYHPRAQKENIPLEQALCTENKHLQEGLKSLKTMFIQRGYKERFIEQQFLKVNEYNRNDLLKYNKKTKRHLN